MTRPLLVKEDASDHRDDGARDREPHTARRCRDQRRNQQRDAGDDHEKRPAGSGDRPEDVPFEFPQDEPSDTDDDEDASEDGESSPPLSR